MWTGWHPIRFTFGIGWGVFTGWHAHPVYISLNVNRIRVSFGCHFQNKMRIGWSSFGCHTVRLEKLPVRHQKSPKHQINYSNQQYHLLIVNKHKKLLTYYLFEDLIEDLEKKKISYESDIETKWVEGTFIFTFFN